MWFLVGLVVGVALEALATELRHRLRERRADALRRVLNAKITKL